MRILLHPDIHPCVAPTITFHDVRTADQEGCSAMELEELLRLAVTRGFGAVIGVASPAFRAQGIDVPPGLRLILIRAPSASYVHFMAYTADGQRGIGLSRDDSVLEIDETVEWEDPPERYNKVVRFFEDRRVPLLRHYPVERGVKQVLRFHLPPDETTVARICREALLELRGVAADEPLLFTFQELRP